jgi:hypothetical protein
LEEEADFCIHLFRQDILTAIGGVVKTVSSSFYLNLQMKY